MSESFNVFSDLELRECSVTNLIIFRNKAHNSKYFQCKWLPMPKGIDVRPNFGKSSSKSLIRLSVNENGIGCSPLVQEAIRTNDLILHRYPEQQDEALINRLGFNNQGCEEISLRIKKNKPKGLLGINIGPNKDSSDRVEDYTTCLKKFINLASYITINISSPNTENLRDFHKTSELNNLIKSILEEKNNSNSSTPIAVKISPDLSSNQVEKISQILIDNKIETIIISNSTDRNREGLTNMNRFEKGGLSGKPIEKISNRIINEFYNLVGKQVKIIGVGGVDSAKSAYEKILSGATLVQLYTGMVYRGPRIAAQINNGLIKILEQEGINNINDVVGLKKSS